MPCGVTELTSPAAKSDETGDSLRLHYLRKDRRCVVSYDTLDAALRSAFKRLQKEAESAP